ncbi:MAG: Zn-dependent hydrolase, partial [Bacteroidales bacterium]|nr:Zn-dependent hydrolase [Bacteroidales bacterium]
EEYAEQIGKVCGLLDKAIALAEDAGLKKYLQERKKAFETDDYFASDMAWMDMKQSRLDFVVGPIENYEDRLFGRKAAYEAFVLVKDEEESAKLAKFTAMLPELQKGLPCDEKFKQEVPGTESDLNVYDAIYYAGDCNSGSKTIAINLPNDEKVQLAKGARRLQLKNAMQAKFDKILQPIANNVMSKEQLANVKFEAFFYNVTFHEVAHGLGIKETVNGKGNVREALSNYYSSWEEAKADILGLYMVCTLIEKGEITSITKDDAVATFIAGILRSVRFGAASAHGVANMMCFNFLEDHKAFTQNADGLYVIDFAAARKAVDAWAAKILEVEGMGDLAEAKAYAEKNGQIRPSLQKSLDKINSLGIPKDIRFEQGRKVLGL